MYALILQRPKQEWNTVQQQTIEFLQTWAQYAILYRITEVPGTFTGHILVMFPRFCRNILKHLQILCMFKLIKP